MIDVRTPISVTMTAERWNQVLAVMSEAPMAHRLTDPLIREIHAQCIAHDARPSPGESNVTQLHEAGC